jgi:peroxiredoxin
MSEHPEVRGTAVPGAPSLEEQLGAITGRTPEQIRARVETAIDEIQSRGEAVGLQIGDVAPDFVLPDALGRPTALTAALETGPVVLTFYRGEWCPYCNLQLRSLQDALADMRALNASLMAVSPQSPDHTLSVAEKHDLEFAVLSDVDQLVIRAHRVQFAVAGELKDLHLNVFHNDPRDKNADGSMNLPVPATFIIDRDGVIRARFVNADWRVRMEPADIIAALRALR